MSIGNGKTLGVALVFAALAACERSERRTTDTASGTVVPSTDAKPSLAERPVPGAPPSGATAAMVALGDSIFHGEVAGGKCSSCHGYDARGGPRGPTLRKHEWRTGDGSYEFLQARILMGSAEPERPYPSPMEVHGGADLTPDQVKAVAAYVYAISRP
jgi:mono/diheme cytochrome c family protein